MYKAYRNFLRLVAMHLELSKKVTFEEQEIVESIKCACEFMSVCNDYESVQFLKVINETKIEFQMNHLPLFHAFIERKELFPLLGEVLERHFHYPSKSDLSTTIYKISEFVEVY